MSTGLSYLTLAVTDLERALAFYHEAFGLPLKHHHQDSNNHRSYAFLELSESVTLALYPPRGLTQLTGSKIEATANSGVLLSYNVASRQEVLSIMTKLQGAGASITQTPCTQPWGSYSGYLRDLDGHLWEIVWSEKRHPAK